MRSSPQPWRQALRGYYSNNDHGRLPVDQISQESRFAVLCECLLPSVFLLLGLVAPRDWDGSNHPGPLDGPTAVLDWIIAAREDNRDCRSCRLGSRAGAEPPRDNTGGLLTTMNVDLRKIGKAARCFPCPQSRQIEF